MSAHGRVVTGYSYPMVAGYSYDSTNSEIVFSNAQFLARGVSWDIALDSNTDDSFYADNRRAEGGEGKFVGGTLTNTVDGLFAAGERFIMGLPAAAADGSYVYDDDQSKPYVASGCVTEWLSDGVYSYTATVLIKTRYNEIPERRETRGANTNYQTTPLTARIEKADDAKHSWKWISADFTTEDAALAALQTYLGYTE